MKKEDREPRSKYNDESKDYSSNRRDRDEYYSSHRDTNDPKEKSGNNQIAEYYTINYEERRIRRDYSPKDKPRSRDISRDGPSPRDRTRPENRRDYSPGVRPKTQKQVQGQAKS